MRLDRMGILLLAFARFASIAGAEPIEERTPPSTDPFLEITPRAPFEAVSWDASGRLISATDTWFQAWDWRSQVEVWRRPVGLRGASHFAIDAEFAAVASTRELAILDLATAETVASWRIPKQKGDLITAMLFLPSGEAHHPALVVGTALGTLCTWRRWRDEETEPLCSTRHSTAIRALAWDPQDGKIFSAATNEIAFSRFESQSAATEQPMGKYIGRLWGSISELTLSRGEDLLAFSNQDGVVFIAPLTGVTQAKTLISGLGPIRTLTFLPDGITLLIGERQGRVNFLNTTTGTLTAPEAHHSSAVQAATLAPEGGLVATASADATLKVWDINTAELVTTLEGHARSIRLTAVSRDGRHLALLSSPFFLTVWDLKSGTEVFRADGRTELAAGMDERSVESLAIATGGQRVAFGLRTGEVLRASLSNHDSATTELIPNGRSPISALEFSPQGLLVAASNVGKIHRWSASGGKPSVLEDVAGSSIDHIAITDEAIFSAHRNGTVHRWPQDGGEPSVILQETGPLRGLMAQGPNMLTIKGDGSYLLFAGSGEVLADQLPPQPLHSAVMSTLSFGGDRRVWADGHGVVSVQKWRGGGFKDAWRLVSGARDTWAACSEDGLCRRQDDGTLLLRRPTGELRPISPPDSAPVEDLSFEVVSKAGPSNGSLGHIAISVKNNGDRAAHWVRLRASEGKAGGPTIFIAPPTLQVLPPGESTELAGKISTCRQMENPEAFKVQVDLEVLTATGSRKLDDPIDISSVVPKIEDFEVGLDDARLNLRVQFRNGPIPLKKGVFIQAKVRGISLPPKTLEGAIDAGELVRLELALPPDFSIQRDTIETEIWSLQHPAFRWTFTETIGDTPSFVSAALAFAGFLLGGFTLLWVSLFRFILDPSVKKIVTTPKELLQIPIDQLAKTAALLRRSRKLEIVLRQLGANPQSLRLASSLFIEDPKTRANTIGRLFSTAPQNEKAGFWKVKLGEDFPLGLSECLLHLPPAGLEAPEILEQLKDHSRGSQRITLVIADTIETQEELALRTGPENPFVAPDGRELTGLFLSPRPQERLAQVIANHVASIHVSPYQSQQGVKKESMFFGRQHFLTEILQNGPANYIVVGTRKIGKSSLLQAIKRRLAAEKDISCHYATLGSEDDILDRLAQLVGLGRKKATEKDLREFFNKDRRRFIFLLDEADSFIRLDKEDGYPTLQTLRSLSEEGKCHFILAGYWTLYRETQRNYQSPLKNFGESLPVGELELEACRSLAEEPMALLQIRFESDDLVDRLITQTGQRPNLIAAACHQMIKGLRPDSRILQSADLEAAFASQKMHEALQVGTLNEESPRLEKIVVYATVEQNEFTTTTLINTLHDLDIDVEIESLDDTLEKLCIACILRKTGPSRYTYQVPLYRSLMLEDDPHTRLAELTGSANR
ncbi:MAG: AAA family ATPase [Acidobacteriota bacterium]